MSNKKGQQSFAVRLPNILSNSPNAVNTKEKLRMSAFSREDNKTEIKLKIESNGAT